jgi:hypothetical protein
MKVKYYFIFAFVFIQVGCKKPSIDIVTDRVVAFEKKYIDNFYNYNVFMLRYNRNYDEFMVERYDGISDYAVISTDRNKMIVKNFYYSEPIDEVFVNNFISTGASEIKVTDEFIKIRYMQQDSIYIVFRGDSNLIQWPKNLVPRDRINHLYNNWRYIAYSKNDLKHR